MRFFSCPYDKIDWHNILNKEKTLFLSKGIDRMYEDVGSTRIYSYICTFSSMVIISITFFIIPSVICAALNECFQSRFILNQYYIDLKESVSTFHRAIHGASWIDYPSSWSETDESETDSETQSDTDWIGYCCNINILNKPTWLFDNGLLQFSFILSTQCISNLM